MALILRSKEQLPAPQRTVVLVTLPANNMHPAFTFDMQKLVMRKLRFEL